MLRSGQGRVNDAPSRSRNWRSTAACC